MIDEEPLGKLRTIITENIRVQRGGAQPVDYVDVSNALGDILARQNHVVFGRRGCGKSLLLSHSARLVPSPIRVVYLNCEDFKNHSFPNVLIEILDTVFGELENHVRGWFGRKRKCQELLQAIRAKLADLRQQEDERTEAVRETQSSQQSEGSRLGVSAFDGLLNLSNLDSAGTRAEIERQYQSVDSKIQKLSLWLPELKRQVREVFELSTTIETVFIQLDDFYHIQRSVQPHVMDYIHRLCKDVPLFFKIATLRHASVLFADRKGQPTGAQERHDYQPISVDFTFQDVRRTEDQLRRIFYQIASQAGIQSHDFDGLFKGEGFRRLILAGGGVPRDCLSLFLAALDSAKSGDGRIGKDDVRILSFADLERRIEDLKKDSEQSEQDSLLRGIYSLRQFCLEKKSNIFLVSEKLLQEEDKVRQLVYRLLDYRIIHSVGTAYTHKSHQGTYQAFMIDIGSYAHLRKLHGKFTEIDLFEQGAKDNIRAAPIVDEPTLLKLWSETPKDVEQALLSSERPKTMEEVEKEKIIEALEQTGGNISAALELLSYGSRQTLLNKMERYGIPRHYGDPAAST